MLETATESKTLLPGAPFEVEYTTEDCVYFKRGDVPDMTAKTSLELDSKACVWTRV